MVLLGKVFAHLWRKTECETDRSIAVDEEDKKLIWIIPAAVGFFWFWFYPYATVLSALAAWGVVKVFRKKVWKEGFVPGGDDITLVSGFCEVVLLAAAVLTMGA